MSSVLECLFGSCKEDRKLFQREVVWLLKQDYWIYLVSSKTLLWNLRDESSQDDTSFEHIAIIIFEIIVI